MRCTYRTLIKGASTTIISRGQIENGELYVGTEEWETIPASRAPSAAEDAATQFLQREDLRVGTSEHITIRVVVQVERCTLSQIVPSGIYTCEFHMGMRTARKPWRNSG